MKYVKILGLLAVAATALMAFAATASATTATSNGSTYTEGIKAANENGHVKLHNETANIECSSSVEGTIENHGPSVTLEGPITALSFGNCTNGWTVHVKQFGRLTAHTIGSGPNATLTSTETTVEATVPVFGITCSYLTNETDIGTLTGSTTTGATATLDISASIPRHSGSAFCGGATSAWTGNYTVTTPDNLDFH